MAPGDFSNSFVLPSQDLDPVDNDWQMMQKPEFGRHNTEQFNPVALEKKQIPANKIPKPLVLFEDNNGASTLNQREKTKTQAFNAPVDMEDGAISLNTKE